MTAESEPLEPEEARKLATKAVVRSQGHSFQGKDLNPFTVDRQIAAAEMGLRYGYVSDSDRVSITQTTSREVGKGKNRKVVQEQTTMEVYRQMFRDIIIVLWLCTIKASDVQRAQRKPDEASSKATKWAQDQGISLLSPAYTEAAVTFFAIMSDIENSRAVGVSDDDDNDEESPPGE